MGELSHWGLKVAGPLNAPHNHNWNGQTILFNALLLSGPSLSHTHTQRQNLSYEHLGNRQAY